MNAYCISDQYCQYKSNTGYCGYTGGCFLDDSKKTIQLTAPINVNLPENWIDLVIERVKQDGDYVLVTRCKDCTRWCICHHSDDWFCADGKRRAE